VIGGLGPEATLDFFAKVLANTPAANDQDHLHVLIDNNPRVPDRNAAVAGTGPSPALALADMARRLEAAGADFLVMPCNAAHAFADAIREAVAIPFVSIIAETRDEVVRRFSDARRVGVLASRGCIDAWLYQEAFAEHGLDVIVPGDDEVTQFMELVYRIKSGDRTAAVTNGIQTVAEGLVQLGAEVIVGGCTEVPLVLGEGDALWPLVNSTDVLVARTIQYARGDTELRSS
jgi:aspartate racemase